jgi:Rps23 Pro-64 3,4-dihydroxylase Tpa1-like proline 4-hydroxylase
LKTLFFIKFCLKRKLEDDLKENKAAILTENASLPIHLDNDGTNVEDQRKISIIIYLNPNWEKKDGGELILYTLDDQIVRVSPSNCILIFFSDQIPHLVETILSDFKRVTLTLWIKTFNRNFLLFNYDKDQFYNILRKHFPQYLY